MVCRRHCRGGLRACFVRLCIRALQLRLFRRILWLGRFTDLNYNSPLAGLSAAASAVAFLLPALFIYVAHSPIIHADCKVIRPAPDLHSDIGHGNCRDWRCLQFSPCRYRGHVQVPRRNRSSGGHELLNQYILKRLVPFAFAGFVTSKAHWRGAAILALLLFIYPITLNKTALF
jgi:hypothetical protein